jgi:8-oxo-dGTP diphosphatase
MAEKTAQKEYCYAYPRPAVTVDAVVFSRRGGREHVLLIRRGQPPFAGNWALPGGFINMDEPLEDAVLRELREETGLAGGKATQIGAFGDPNRDPRGRVIGIAYLVEPNAQAEIKAGDDAAEARWWPLDDLPPLAFDHDKILYAARGLAAG